MTSALHHFSTYCMDGDGENVLYYDQYGGALLGTIPAANFFNTVVKDHLDLANTGFRTAEAMKMDKEYVCIAL